MEAVEEEQTAAEALELELSSTESEKANAVEIIATNPPITDEVKPFVVGDVIQHNYLEGGQWWDDYRITAINNDDTTNPLYELTYADDSMVSDVPAALIRHPESEVEKAVRELPLLNRKIEVLQSKLAVARMETSHGKTDVLTLDALETLLDLVLADSTPGDTLDRVDIKWTRFYGESHEVLKLCDRLVEGRKQSSDTIDGNTVTRALSLKQRIDGMYYGSEEANTRFLSLKQTADDYIKYASHYRDALVLLQEASQLWNQIMDCRMLTDDAEALVTKDRIDRQIAAVEALLETKISVSFKSGSVADVYDPSAVEALTNLMTSFIVIPEGYGGRPDYW